MTDFDRIVVVDWSARSAPSPVRPAADAIWIAEAGADGSLSTAYHRTRSAAMAALTARLAACRAVGERVLAGFDFPFGYPAGFARAVTGGDDPLALWDALADRIVDGPDNANNRFEVAAALNALLPGTGPFWGRPVRPDVPGLPARGTARQGHGLPERRAVEVRLRTAQPCWKLYTTGSVGSQALLGLPHLARLRARFGADLAVWPFQSADAALVLAEVYPSLLNEAVRAELATATAPPVKDAAQVRVLARALMTAQRDGTLAAMLDAVPDGPPQREEGWILGAGAEASLRAAAAPGLVPPRLSNDCFALPQGVDWTPVDDALALLRDRLRPVVPQLTCATVDALGRVLAEDATAARSNPPGANSAVDGYGFAAAATGAGRQVLPLVSGRAAAGAAYRGRVPDGHAVRILTGALVPDGVDTVVLQEDVAVRDGQIAFDGPVKPGANTRRAGEDVERGALALPAGRVLTAADLALLSALGLAELAVFARLRVGVLSTGDELVAAGSAAGPDRTYDANRPMLLALAARWGHAPVDLGHVGDDRAALRAVLDGAAARADVILTSGGASAGDEDHVSALLKSEGALDSWRIAVKPGRPLALGMWHGVPVIGLPGNPVAAFVCTLVFARPALARLSGADWSVPRGFTVPAAFSKSKKPGRREYLRARLSPDGAAEVFASEGSGRISGLSWAEGLVELGDGAQRIAPGDPVRYLPFGAFGL
ncbi:molybdopterin molybdenumtransferase MoeA [Meridianimarinicoccus roseus]|uniref:Molybdopterin molybdenumtransferase n=1 Tax=Meridianimarinicoccus roseus TaxID=2072018 RepID=A0A2V2L8I9_9RHOB|nr:gephyrin-like molybdotransferase Glp [Meridianimarinicoccus roseus]PWR01738.1 molybdopterin molybdenumtransferase MoeA [Meridianimarinicoccus roseus]